MINTLINELAEQISQIDGVCAVVLGGSRARGTHTSSSDIDLGIYYDPASPLNLQALNHLATRLDDERRSGILTGIGGWGPWINGGGWLKVQSIPVDFLYRDLQQVEAVIAACRAGQVEIAYQPGHPHGFVSSIYLAEVAVCRPVWDGQQRIAALKRLVCPYPPDLKRALVQKFGWEIDFALQIGKKAVGRGDVSYVAGCCFRAVSCLMHVLFALNEQYWLNEKGAVSLAETFAQRPAQLQKRIEEAFANLVADPDRLATALDILSELAQEVEL